MTTATSEYEVGEEIGSRSFGTARGIQTVDDDALLLFSAPVAGAGLSFGFSRVGSVPRLLLAAVLTSPVMFFNPDEDNRRSGVHSTMIRRDVPPPRRIAIKQARLLALQVLAET